MNFLITQDGEANESGSEGVMNAVRSFIAAYDALPDGETLVIRKASYLERARDKVAYLQSMDVADKAVDGSNTVIYLSSRR